MQYEQGWLWIHGLNVSWNPSKENVAQPTLEMAFPMRESGVFEVNLQASSPQVALERALLIFTSANFACIVYP